MEQDREKKIYRVTIVGSVVNFLLILVKLTAGIFGRSSALVADAIHSVSDFFTDIIVLFFIRIANQPTDKNHDFGHGKFETLATLIIGFVLLLVGLGLLWSGVTQIYGYLKGGDLPRPHTAAFIVALVSLIGKEWLYRYTVKIGRRLRSDVVIANAWHHRTDAYTSIATVAGIGCAILLGDKWVIMDPIAAAVVSIFIITTSFQLMRPSIDELVERSLPDEVEQQILDIISSFPQVCDPHNLRTRKIGNYYAIDFHVRADGNLSLDQAHTIATLIEVRLRQEYGDKSYINIHVEPKKPL